jgi:hypothetical protein
MEPLNAAFTAILTRGSSSSDDHVHVIIEFCGLLADGGSRCAQLFSLFFSSKLFISLQTHGLTTRHPFFPLVSSLSCVAVRRNPRWRLWRAPSQVREREAKHNL